MSHRKRHGFYQARKRATWRKTLWLTQYRAGINKSITSKTLCLASGQKLFLPKHAIHIEITPDYCVGIQTIKSERVISVGGY